MDRFIHGRRQDDSWIGYPVAGRITTEYGEPSAAGGHPHRGIDIACYRAPVFAPCDGIAHTYTWGTFGWWVVIEHESGLNVCLAHLSAFHVTDGELVKVGDLIGVSGGVPGEPGAGLSTGAHLHFELNTFPLISGVWEDSRNPEDYTVEEEIDMEALEALKQQVADLTLIVGGYGIDLNGDKKPEHLNQEAIEYLKTKQISLAGSVVNQNEAMLALLASVGRIEAQLAELRAAGLKTVKVSGELNVIDS